MTGFWKASRLRNLVLEALRLKLANFIKEFIDN